MKCKPLFFIFVLLVLAACETPEEVIQVTRPFVPTDVVVTETAVSTYLALIQQAPTSPWSWLAWARLEPVN